MLIKSIDLIQPTLIEGVPDQLIKGATMVFSVYTVYSRRVELLLTY